MPDAYHRLHIYHLNIRTEDMCCAQAGDHVKVNSGQHEGQTGMVVRVEDPVCVLVSDATHEELQVFARDLTESSEAATGLDRSVRQSLKGHNMHTLYCASRSHTQHDKGQQLAERHVRTEL